MNTKTITGSGLNLGTQLTNSDLVDVHNKINDVVEEIRKASDEFVVEARRLGALAADRYIEEAKGILKVYDMEWGGEKLTMDIRKAKAMTEPHVEAALREYLITKSIVEALDGRIKSLSKVLSGLQTEAHLLKTEASIAQYD